MSKDTHNPQNLCVKQDKDKLKDLNFSLFIGGIKQVIPKQNIDPNGLVELLQSSKQKELTAKIIAAKTDTEKQALKLQSYFFTPYGTFSYRKDESIIDYNAHVVAFDWDKMEAEQVAKLIAILIQTPCCFLCTKSPRQKGVKALILISQAIPLETHYLTLKTNAKRLLKALGVLEFSDYLDFAQFKLSQPFFLSYDENLQYNPNAEPLQIKLLAVDEPQNNNDYQLEKLKRDFEDIGEPQSLNEFLINETQKVIDGFDPDGSRHPQIAKTKTLFGLLKQYPQNTVYDEVYTMLYDAMGELYSSPAEAKSQNAYKSLKDAQEAATPQISEAIERLLKGTPEHRNKYRVYVDEVLTPPQVAIYMNNEILGTLGNFSLVIGKAKAKKSFLIAMLCAAALRTEQAENKIIHALPADQNEVALFDTEMSKYHVQLAARRIHTMANSPNAAQVFNLRSLAPAERLQFIDDEVRSNPRLGLVIIDGIKDLVTSINDEEQASMIASWLLKISEERNIHIIVVLHQNKSDNNARGHIGTELINKAETVLSVTVLEHDNTISVVEAAQVRNKEPHPFAFSIDEDGIPQIIEDYEPTKPRAEKRAGVPDVGFATLRGVIDVTFSKDSSLSYAELIERLPQAYEEILGISIGISKTKQIIKDCREGGLIEQPKKLGNYILPNASLF